MIYAYAYRETETLCPPSGAGQFKSVQLHWLIKRVSRRDMQMALRWHFHHYGFSLWIHKYTNWHTLTPTLAGKPVWKTKTSFCDTLPIANRRPPTTDRRLPTSDPIPVSVSVLVPVSIPVHSGSQRLWAQLRPSLMGMYTYSAYPFLSPPCTQSHTHTTVCGV